jgi:hypothetical protein
MGVIHPSGLFLPWLSGELVGDAHPSVPGMG